MFKLCANFSRSIVINRLLIRRQYGHSLSERIIRDRSTGDQQQSLSYKTAQEAVNNILYSSTNANTGALSAPSRRTLACLVNNEPGVLSKISGILAGRGFNIDSLVVSATQIPDLSRMTLVVRGDRSVVEQARKQLEDLVPVWCVLDYSDIPVLERELLLVKVNLTEQQNIQSDSEPDIIKDAAEISMVQHEKRHALVELTRLFNGRVLDLTRSSITMEICAKPTRIDAFLELCRPYRISEACRSGMIAMPRSPVLQNNSLLSSDEEGIQVSKVDATMLPPG